MNRLLSPTALAVLALAMGGCGDEHREREVTLTSFDVHVISPAIECDDRGRPVPLPVPRTAVPVTLEARAIGSDGRPFPFTGRARVAVTPGRTVPALTGIEFVDGVAAPQTITVLAVHSDAEIWVIDDVPEEGRPVPSYAAGVGETLPYDRPTLADVNQLPPNGDNTQSAYAGDYLELDVVDPDTGDLTRELLVTAIFNEGFYVTDLTEGPHSLYPGNFGALYVYSYSYPEYLLPGDRLTTLTGTLMDFSGHTQISFPTWTTAPDDGDGLAALATLEATAPAITPTICGGGSTSSIQSQILCGYSSANLHLESLESSLVVLPEIRTPDLWVRCDFDGNGEVANFGQYQATGNEPPGEPIPAFGCFAEDEECACNLACLTSGVFESTVPGRSFDATGKVCAELGTYERYGQYPVRLVNGGVPGPRIGLATRDSVPAFDPRAQGAAGAGLWARGMLRHVRAGRPRWVVVARDPSDLCCTDSASCPDGLAPCGF